MPRSYGDFTTTFAAALLVICILCTLIFSITMNGTTSVSAVEAKGVRVYWDSNCTELVSLIDWGTLEPGSVKNIAVYIRNEGEEPRYLILSTTNWNPSNASEYITLEWDHSGRRIDPDETLQITLTLSVLRYIQGISVFSFDILITGIYSLPGDVDGDGFVGSVDLFLLTTAIGSVPGDPNWDPNCDFDGDGYVGSTDLYILAANYGESA